MVMFQGKYYLFASMTGSVWVSEDMAHWDSYPLPENMPIYDYAPDVRAIGEYLYFTASSRDVKCSFYRTRIRSMGRMKKYRAIWIIGIRTCSRMMMADSIFTGDAQMRHLSGG